MIVEELSSRKKKIFFSVVILYFLVGFVLILVFLTKYFGPNGASLIGTQINIDMLKKMENELGKKLIPMYGHYAGKSSIGFTNGVSIVHLGGGKIYFSSDIAYFPSFPVTYIYMNYKEKSPVYGEKAPTKMIVAEPELLLINDEDYAERTKPTKTTKAFKKRDGTSNLSRS